ncbi:MAG: ATP-binding protein [Lachnospiraceae bacterium]|nr:ATP-binding protein [Lachnospiraceae bacterium]
MTYKKLSITDIQRDYDKTRQRNTRTENDRQAEIYSKLPRIKELDEEIKLSYLNAARMGIMNKDAEDIEQLKAKAKELSREKASLLTSAGYPDDYLSPIYDCPICQDTGFVNQQKCSCFRAKIIDALYLQSNMQNVFKKENFDTFNTSYYSKEVPNNKEYSPYDNIISVLERAHNFVDAFDSSKTAGILIYGETGLGKTFLTNCIAKELLDREHSVFYLSTNELFDRILSNYIMNNNTDYEDLYRYLYSCELLIIDDLGTELTNNFVRSELFEIINKREISERKTLISTNLSMKDLRDRYSERIMSRIIDNYTVFNIYGDNIRYQKRKNAINQAN